MKKLFVFVLAWWFFLPASTHGGMILGPFLYKEYCDRVREEVVKARSGWSLDHQPSSCWES